jgi:hypothetical protein
MTLLYQLFPELDVVEDLAIEGNVEPPVCGGHGLSSTFDVNDAESSVSQARLCIMEDTNVIWTAMPNAHDHSVKQVQIYDPAF